MYKEIAPDSKDNPYKNAGSFTGEGWERTSISFPEWSDTSPITDKILRSQEITEEYALRLFFVLERYDPGSNSKGYLQELRREYAKHPDHQNTEYFPYVMYRVNGQRVILEVKTKDERFKIRDPDGDDRDPDSGELIRKWDFKPSPLYVISKKNYENRDYLLTSKSRLEKIKDLDTDHWMLFEDIKAKIGFHIDVKPWVSSLMALWIIGTYVYRIFKAYPYLYLNADFGSGKTRALETILALADTPLKEVYVNPTPAPVFRTVDALGCCMAFDELEGLNTKDNPDLVQLLNSGYKFGATVPRYDMDARMLVKFHTYSPKALAGIKTPDPVLGSRCIFIPLLRSKDPKFTHREPFQEPYYSDLVDIADELIAWAIDYGPWIKRMDWKTVYEKYKSRFKDLPPRVFQISLPLLVIYEAMNLDEKGEGENLSRILQYQAESALYSVPEHQETIIRALYVCVQRSDSITVQAIQDEIVAQFLAQMGKFEEELNKTEANQLAQLKKFYSTRKIGRQLSKYEIPKVKRSQIKYFPDSTKEYRVDFVRDIAERYQFDLDGRVERIVNEIAEEQLRFNIGDGDFGGSA
jgi:hypothetical protein